MPSNTERSSAPQSLRQGGGCRRTFMVRLFTDILTVSPGAANQIFRGGRDLAGMPPEGIVTAYFWAE